MKIDENVWKYFQDRLDYSAKEMEIFKNDPRWSRVLEKSDDLLKNYHLRSDRIPWMQYRA